MPINAYAMDNNRERQAEPDRADILIVDDRPDKLLVYGTILEDLGQNLFTAASGEQALKLAAPVEESLSRLLSMLGAG